MQEKLEDILKPKSEEDIISSMDDLSPKELFNQSAENGFLPGVKRAIERGVDIHALDDWALRWASQYGRYDIVALLLENGADVHVVVDLPLRWASEMGQYDIVEILLKHGANVHADNDYALRWASENGHYDIVELLKRYT
ncbi:MAG: ankyrin repeat domain-containing protein [Nitrosopumilus sp.]